MLWLNELDHFQTLILFKICPLTLKGLMIGQNVVSNIVMKLNYLVRNILEYFDSFLRLWLV